jgi:hypothetical protein
MTTTIIQENTREADHNVNSIFVNRWSPRSMTEEEVDEND